jgi:hypothetical protein
MKVKPYFMIHKPHVHSNEPFHNSSDVVHNQPTPKPHSHTNDPFNNKSSIRAFTNAPSYDEHAQSQNNNPNLITNTLHVAHLTETPSTHEASLPPISCFHDYPSSNMSPPPRVSPPHPTTIDLVASFS